MISVVVLSVLLAAAVAGLAALLVARKVPTLKRAPKIQPHRRRLYFLEGFLTGPEEPWVIFSNAAFTGRPDRGCVIYDPATGFENANPWILHGRR